MNQTIEVFTRNTIKEGLALCTEGQQKMFKRMYSHKNLERNIDSIVDELPAEKLEHALTQVENTLNK